MKFAGRTWVFGDNINTDLMYPNTSFRATEEERRKLVFSANRPGWSTVVRQGDILVGGLNFGTDVKGNLVMYAGGDFNAYLGGVTNGPIFAEGSLFADTKWLFLYSARDFNMGTDNWANSTNWPLGLPSTYPVFNRGYHVRTEEPGTDLGVNYNPRWQKRKSS